MAVGRLPRPEAYQQIRDPARFSPCSARSSPRESTNTPIIWPVTTSQVKGYLANVAGLTAARDHAKKRSGCSASTCCSRRTRTGWKSWIAVDAVDLILLPPEPARTVPHDGPAGARWWLPTRLIARVGRVPRGIAKRGEMPVREPAIASAATRPESAMGRSRNPRSGQHDGFVT
jgi:hypothetical protein